MHVKQENTVKPRGATTEMRGEMEWWTELNTGQSWRVWTDQRREAEIGSFWLEENRKEVWPTTAWGGATRNKTTKKTKQTEARERDSQWERERDRQTSTITTRHQPVCNSTVISLAAEKKAGSALHSQPAWSTHRLGMTVEETRLHTEHKSTSRSGEPFVYSFCMEVN